MNNSWWKNISELDDQQKSFIGLPKEGKYLLTGPPGCGKTNLLLLRAKFLHGSGMKNIIFITLTRSLSDFIRTGVSERKYLEADQITTFRKWARNHVATFAREKLDEFPAAAGGSYADAQDKVIELLRYANTRRPTSRIYDAIFVDEVQDLKREELAVLNELSPNICVSGDSNQTIHAGNALRGDFRGYQRIELKYHYRIGRNICAVADKLLSDNPLLPTCMYNEQKLESEASLIPAASREEQATKIAEKIQTQKKAYLGELIGIITPKKESLSELRDYFEKLGFRGVAYHDMGDDDNTFSSDHLVHALTVHSAKGTEFRALHIFAGEDFKFPLHKRELMYTAVTRAKTSLLIHHTGKICAPLDSALAKPTSVEVEDLF